MQPMDKVRQPPGMPKTHGLGILKRLKFSKSQKQTDKFICSDDYV